MRVDPSNIDKLVGIQDAKAPVVEFKNTVRPQFAKDAIDVNTGETRRIPDVLLG